LNRRSLYKREMLVFDIETTGLDPEHSVVTVVCTEDFETGERRAYEFARVRACEPENEELLRTILRWPWPATLHGSCLLWNF